jgi:hypothetical protein
MSTPTLTSRTLTCEGRTTHEGATPTWTRESSGMRRLSRRSRDAAWEKKVLEATRLYNRARTGSRRDLADFSEAMTTSDFPLLMGDVLDRALVAKYDRWPTVWTSVAKRGTVRDFRTVKRFRLDGGGAVLEKVAQRSEYPEAGLSENYYSYSVAKYGKRLSIDWEMLINDDLDAFRDLPSTLAEAARQTEEKFVTDLYVNSTGPDGTFFAAGNANIVTRNPVLSVSGLQTAFTVLNSHTDTDGNPIYINGAVLMIPPALEVTAQNILNATQLLAATGGGSGDSNDQLQVANWMRNRLTLQVNPWLPLVDTTSGSTAWYLFANPGNGRPAMEVGFLRGNESPSLYVKAPDSMRIGGGLAPVEDGDFDTDGIQYKVRHVLGGTLMDPYMAAASDGTADAGS